MNWIKFKNKFFDLGCFSIHQIYAWEPEFSRNNFSRWIKKGYLKRLKRGWYSFPEYMDKPGMGEYFAGKIYKPSYISLHTAMSSFGLIPESVVQITSVTSLKTQSFKNSFGEYSYKSVRQDLLFGYFQSETYKSFSTCYATCEKALLDLLYLYPFYDSKTELENLRLDSYVLHNSIDKQKMELYSDRFNSKVLEKRMKLLFKVYDL